MRPGPVPFRNPNHARAKKLLQKLRPNDLKRNPGSSKQTHVDYAGGKPSTTVTTRVPGPMAAASAVDSAKTNPQRYKAATNYAQKVGLKLSPVTSGPASTPATKEFGQKKNIGREEKLASSFANRTTTASRKRAVQRLLTQFGIRSNAS